MEIARKQEAGRLSAEADSGRESIGTLRMFSSPKGEYEALKLSKRCHILASDCIPSASTSSLETSRIPCGLGIVVVIVVVVFRHHRCCCCMLLLLLLLFK